ncbi:hypothetical protein [Aeoliella sp.]|uniref:hypothetical protein n=1 Tax=Aeoliella sp. TaxID=2795800 RepID=UPI003CCBEB61
MIRIFDQHGDQFLGRSGGQFGYRLVTSGDLGLEVVGRVGVPDVFQEPLGILHRLSRQQPEQANDSHNDEHYRYECHSPTHALAPIQN